MVTMDLRPIQAAEEAVETFQHKAKGKLLDWLPRHTCEACGAVCTAENEFVEQQAIYMDVWVCPNEDCSKRYYRDEGNPLRAEMWR